MDALAILAIDGMPTFPVFTRTKLDVVVMPNAPSGSSIPTCCNVGPAGGDTSPTTMVVDAAEGGPVDPIPNKSVLNVINGLLNMPCLLQVPDSGRGPVQRCL